ncbi:MAG: tetratricopeptide repeat protein [Gammaproteobacteria bacterium]|nr:tetratricopeptide repeat protein [Gammaproteobacteria bacterium]
MTSLFSELKRRNVIRVGAAYLVATWVLLQIGDVLIAMLELPGWVGKLLVLLTVLGFPIALIFAWAFEITPEGLKVEADVDRSVSITSVTAKKLDMITIGLVIVALAVFTMDRFLDSGREQTSAEMQTEVARPEQASVAVLPFANISQDAKNEPFTIGIHDDLLTQISKIGSIKTISRTSVSQYRETTKPFDQIASELGVATILEGGVQRAGDQVRINVQLVDAQTNEQLWAERYERRLTAANIFVIQSEIVKAIADALQTTLSADERNRIDSVPTENLEALEFYFAGHQRLALRNTEAFKEAIYYFEQAVALDPEFALAYVGLADSYQLQEDAGGLSRDEMFVKAGAALEKALMLDSSLGEAYNSMGGVEWTAGDWAGAEAMFKRSIELNPNYATTYLWYGTLLVEMGRVEEAVRYYGLGLERDPLSPVLNESLGTAMEFRGQYDEAVKQYRWAIHLNETFASSFLYLGNVNWAALGHIDQAIACHKKSIEYDPGARLPRLYRGLLYLDLGDVQKAEPWIGSSLRLAPLSLGPLAGMALLDWYRGKESEALRNAEKAQKIAPYYWDHRLFQSMALSLLRNFDLQQGNLDGARAWYEDAYPGLLDSDEPAINLQNYRAAIDLAYVLQQSGDFKRAETLLDRSLAFIEAGSTSRLGVGGYGIADVQIHALQGDGQRALAALRQAIDRGWRAFWWFYLKGNPNLHALHDDAEFQSMVQEVESSMLGQHEKPGGAETCSVL